MSPIELEGEAKERYTLKSDCNYGSKLNVYKAYKKNDPETHYVIKSYETKEALERESQMLKELNGAKNIVQMVDVYPSQSIIICESALHDLETFLEHLDHIQRQGKKSSIIKDIASGLSEIQNHGIVHTALAPKNIMYFQDKNGSSGSWKLIDFSTACSTGSNYSLDMFSFGLILYFLETGHHYWDGENKEKKDEVTSTTKDLQLHDIRDPTMHSIIRSLLNKKISRRMTLDHFMRSFFYTGESTDHEVNDEVSKPNSTYLSALSVSNFSQDSYVTESTSQPSSTYLSALNVSNFSQDSRVTESVSQSNSTSLLRPNSTSLSRPNSSSLSRLNSTSTTLSRQNSTSASRPSSPYPSSLNGSNLFQDSCAPENWNYSKFDIKSLTDPLDSYYAFEYAFKMLSEVIENVVESGRKHFRKDDIREIAKKMRGYLNKFNHQDWDNNDQKVQFISILKNQVHLYNRFLWLVVRYCAVKDRVANSSLAKLISTLYRDVIEISSIIKAGKSFNSYLSKLIVALNSHDSNKIQKVLNNFSSDSSLNLSFGDDSAITLSLSRWYCSKRQICNDYIGTPSKELENRGEIFITKRLYLSNSIVTGKSLNYLNYKTFLCVIKEISLYNDHQLNDCDNIIKFCGYSIQHCKCKLFYEYTDYGDLFEYFQSDHNSSGHSLNNWKNKVNLAWGISLGVRYLHDRQIVHLDLRSKNISLKFDEEEGTIIPKISNFLWSREIYSGKTSTYPITTLPSGEEIWKRWYDPDRLRNKKRYDFLPPSDIYSLGLLYWEIAWCKPNNLPFEEVPIRNLYNHLLYNNYEDLPEIPDEYRGWEYLIEGMWKFNAEDRCNIITVELTMRKLCKGTESP
ncbi:kinase-like domain-containing protein [Rhizophagus clarus]|uniref:Kinase-like domain-containing protein n=1 Tax=Rhizophagus clarus TaxID=94130 RepID=A0A8H3LAJ1_9GLOM|nr:kinase-like domain-containing protein [Rhizophagus clarus]